jgi:hypothetical protein
MPRVSHFHYIGQVVYTLPPARCRVLLLLDTIYEIGMHETQVLELGTELGTSSLKATGIRSTRNMMLGAELATALGSRLRPPLLKDRSDQIHAGMVHGKRAGF